jgi:hypothetical protein
MDRFAFLPFEVLMALLFSLCLRHAMRTGLQNTLKLGAGVCFGILLEWATIEQLDAYQYGWRYLIMIDTVPIAIGVGWGVILYSAMLFSAHTTLNEWVRPVLDALLALNIDLAMDAIAIRIGMWDWGKGLEHDYFGVPYENFWAWFWVIFCFSMAYRILNRFSGRYRVVVAPLGAIVLGIPGVLATNRIIVSFVPEEYELPVIAAVLCGALLIVALNRPRLVSPDVVHLAAWVPLSFHFCFILLGAFFGAFAEHVTLLVVSVAMAALSLYLHRAVICKLPATLYHLLP